MHLQVMLGITMKDEITIEGWNRQVLMSMQAMIWMRYGGPEAS